MTPSPFGKSDSFSFVQDTTNEIYRCKKMPSLDITPCQIILNLRSCNCKNISHIHPGFPSGFFPSLANYRFVNMLISIIYVPRAVQWNVRFPPRAKDVSLQQN
jgi:hypothetical protein